MFVIGDNIVYPMHGAGTINAIEEREAASGEKCRYYVIMIAGSGMKITIPCDKAAQIGVRGVIKKSEYKGVHEVLCGVSTEMAKIWNRRYRDNQEKMKTGKVTHVAEVVRDLMRVDREKKLATGEKKMLSSAKQILISELTLAVGKGEDELSALIEKAVMTY